MPTMCGAMPKPSLSSLGITTGAIHCGGPCHKSNTRSWSKKIGIYSSNLLYIINLFFLGQASREPQRQTGCSYSLQYGVYIDAPMYNNWDTVQVEQNPCYIKWALDRLPGGMTYILGAACAVDRFPVVINWSSCIHPDGDVTVAGVASTRSLVLFDHMAIEKKKKKVQINPFKYGQSLFR